jgi:two-component system sensor histidine kinase KdpD
MARIAVKHTSEVFDSQVVMLMPGAEGKLAYPSGSALPNSLHGADLGVAQWVFDNGKRAGFGTDTLPGHDAVYLPLRAVSGTLGVLAVLPANPRRVLLPEQAHFLETFSAQIASALERAVLASRAQESAVRAQDEETRSALLASISHDLRTPLAVIVGASSALLQNEPSLAPEARREMARTVYDEANQMTQLVNNVLDLTRLEAGALALRRDWFPLDELVGTALDRLRDRLKTHRVAITLPKSLPLIWADGVLLEQAIFNLLENAAKHTPPGTLIEIGASATEKDVTVTVADNGPGLKPGEESRVFDKFHRGERESSVGGAGLGLTICKVIVEAHGGTIGAESRAGLGALFRFTLPRGPDAPLDIKE